MSCATKNGTGTNEKEKGLVKDDEYPVKGLPE